MDSNKHRASRWYFGGVASTMAVCLTHPFDLMKVLLQTQEERISIAKLTTKVVRSDGFMGLYNGISAALLKQMTYSMTRFAMYDVCKNCYARNAGYEPNFAAKMACAAVSGAVGGFLSTPADLVNVRLQNDVKLANNQRRNYHHVFHGFVRVCLDEGPLKLMSGASMAMSRAVLITVGQLVFYDQVKMYMLSSDYPDNTRTHLLSSLSAGAIATTLAHPLDMLKTLKMNARPGEFSSISAIVKHTAKLGPLGFYKGYIPAFIRIAPHTVFTLLFLEELRTNFGYLPDKLYMYHRL